MQKLLIVHGGGPTAVLNASLYGAVAEAQASGQIDAVYGAIGGTAGVLAERFARFDTVPEARLTLLTRTPGTAIGTSRHPLMADDYQRMVEICRRHGIGYVLFSGGNGTMDACGRLHRLCAPEGILVGGIPKTIDNDISITDHSPGYGSAARFIATAAAQIAMDLQALPIHVCILEAMGRNAGWIAAASALARDVTAGGPHLIYLPERPFDEAAFLRDAERLHRRHGGVLVVVSEGLAGEGGRALVPPIFKSDRATYAGDIGTHLAQLVVRELGIKARSEKPGILGRASIDCQSPVDCEEAVATGRAAVRMVLSGQGGAMIGCRRLPGEAYATETFPIPLEDVMLAERTMPDAFISPEGNDVTPAFVRWARPLIGPPLAPFFTL